MAEQGFPNVEAEIWLGFLGRSKVADAWTTKFQAALKKTMEKPETREKISKLVSVEYKSREDFSKIIAKDFEVWTPILTAFGLINK